MIEVHNLSKHYGERVAVDDLSFVVKPGVVTGFLGPNGSGKSTTMRLILGLDAPTTGTALVGGRAYRDIPDPLHEIGAMLEARAIHSGRSARNHLRAMAATHGIPDSRVQELIELVGLGQVARKRVGTFSLGMGQRLGIASSLLGDPNVVVLDEPVNGLDPEGIRWVRELLRRLADEGKTADAGHQAAGRRRQSGAGAAFGVDQAVVAALHSLVAGVRAARDAARNRCGGVRHGTLVAAPA